LEIWNYISIKLGVKVEDSFNSTKIKFTKHYFKISLTFFKKRIEVVSTILESTNKFGRNFLKNK
jgi:hypothetical protein